MNTEYKGGTYSITPEGLHYVVVVTVGGRTFAEDFRSRTVGKTGRAQYADAVAFAQARIEGRSRLTNRSPYRKKT
jgi:cell division protein FtsI/penicillin-binding protein 2